MRRIYAPSKIAAAAAVIVTPLRGSGNLAANSGEFLGTTRRSSTIGIVLVSAGTGTASTAFRQRQSRCFTR